MDNRKHMGKDKERVTFPVAPNLSEMGDSYLEFIDEIKKEIQKQRISVVMNANVSMICICWQAGSFRGWRTGFLYRSLILPFKIALLCRNRIESP